LIAILCAPGVPRPRRLHGPEIVFEVLPLQLVLLYTDF
jgi:hypothetical protein